MHDSPVRIIGLVSSIVAVAAIGVTLEADNWISGFGGSVTRAERIFLLIVAVAIGLGHFVLRLARRPPRKGAHLNGKK
jgi:hypothetical protein